MNEWSDYRMWRRVGNAMAVGGNSAEWLGNWQSTEITFRARSQKEAQGKADRFWRDAELGFGSMVCIPVGSDPTESERGRVNDEGLYR